MNTEEITQKVKSERKAALVVNTRARQGQTLYKDAITLLEAQGFTLVEKHPVSKPARLADAVKGCIARGAPLVIVGGGDGTVSSVCDYFAYRDVVFGLLPLGTGNSFAQTLGVPFDLPGAVKVIAEGKVAAVDLGKVGDDYFADMSTIGISAEMGRHIPQRIKRVFGPLAYVLAWLRVFSFHKAFRCTLRTPESEQAIETHEIIIGNGVFYGRTPIAAEASVVDHQLRVFIMGRKSRWQLLKAGFAFIIGQHHKSPDAYLFSTPEVEIITEPPQPIDLDGEVTARTPACISVAPHALKVLVPQEFPER